MDAVKLGASRKQLLVWLFTRCIALEARLLTARIENAMLKVALKRGLGYEV